jgi:hypothetical protein
MGWFKTWDEEWLNDESLKKVGLENQGAFVRIKCLANICLAEGKLTLCGIVLTREQILQKSGIENNNLLCLEKHGLVCRSDNGEYCVPGHKKWQSEYERQKGYRQRLQAKVTSKGTSEEVRSKKEERRSKTKD